MKRSHYHLGAMLCLGLAAILTLALIPYSLTQTVVERKPATSSVSAGSSAASETSAAKTSSAEPLFDAALWYASRNEAPETHGVMIESLNHERLFASHNADEAFNPASLIKLATSLVALKKLGADYRFRTQVFADGRTDEKGTFHGQLFFMGNDPSLGDVAASMIAAELRARGIKKLAGSINVSADFCFNFSESAEDSAARLSKALHLGEDVTTAIAAEPSGNRLLIFNSYPLRDLLLYMNARSSNFMAERVGAQIGGAQAVQQFLVDELKLPAPQVTIARVSGREHNRMTPRGLLTVIRALVEEAARQGMRPEDIMPVASDDTGTLRRRLAGTGLEGAVIGKTGTLTSEVDGGMASLAGIVYTYDKGMIVFAILDRGNRIWDNRQMEDQLLAEVINSQAAPLAIANAEQRRQLLPSSNLRIEK